MESLLQQIYRITEKSSDKDAWLPYTIGSTAFARNAYYMGPWHAFDSLTILTTEMSVVF